MKRPKVMVIGLDGASFNFLEPFCAEGVMPNLQRFRQDGCAGELVSAYPPITPAAWVTFMTGKLPGRHHVLDFEQFRFADNSLRYNTSADVRGRTIWRIASDAGRKVAAINVPMTYPPEPVNGVMIAGHNVPNPESPYTWPADFKDKLLERIPDYLQVKPARGRIEDEAVFDSFVAALTRTVDHYHQAVRFVDEQLDWDLLMTVFPHTDMGHLVWRYMDPEIAGRYPQRRERIRGIFGRLDEALGDLFALARQRGAAVVIMSDHGHGRQRGWVRANKLLQQWGYIRMASPLRWLGRRVRREFQKIRYPDKYSRPARYVDEKLGIDWARSRAAVCHTAMWGFLYLNVRGRQPQGMVAPGSEYEASRDDLIRRFSAEKDPLTGEALFPEVIKPETVYGESEATWDCPDLLLVPQEGMKVNRRTRGKWTVKYTDPATADGTHLLGGLWMAAGEAIRTGESFRASIQDIAPTVLALLDLPVPRDMDGRVLDKIFDHAPQVRYVEPAAAPSAPPAQAGYSAEEEEQIQQHLADLGYLD